MVHFIELSYTPKPLPPGELAPGLYRASPDEILGLLGTGEHVDLSDFRNACLDVAVPVVNASRTFGRVVGYLAQSLDNSHRWELDRATMWTVGNPDLAGRSQLLIGTQCLADMVEEHENDAFDVPARIFTKKNWRIMRAVVRGEFEILLNSEPAQTPLLLQRKTHLDSDEYDEA